MGKVKTAILVTFFTVLIWVLAEGESLQTKRTLADVTFPTTTSESYTVRVADPMAWRGGVELLVEGPTASLEGLEQALRRPITLEPGMAGVPRESGERVLDLREALREHPWFRSRGVTVLSAEPEASSAPSALALSAMTAHSCPRSTLAGASSCCRSHSRML